MKPNFSVYKNFILYIKITLGKILNFCSCIVESLSQESRSEAIKFTQFIES